MTDRFYTVVEVPDVAADPSAPAAGFVAYYGKGKKPYARNSDGVAFDLSSAQSFLGNSATPETGIVDVRTFSGVTDANGRFIVQATADGLAGGVAQFSAFRMISAYVGTLAGAINDQVFPGGYGLTNSSKTITWQFLRGNVTGVLIGGTINSLRAAPAGINVAVRVEGIRA